ncbi:MAG: sulfite exporter TauE/SafE family protein [Gammaproteobacteria bacterium]|nr:sulfite exporter TauE/SafE family protein [Gammaproteobacteria bacterium]
MIDEFTLISAFILGLLGAPHCAGMCGGIVGALSVGCQPAVNTSSQRLLFVIAYNIGRISSYVIAGMLVGGFAALATNLIALHYAQLVLQALAALFMLFLGLYLGGWWPVLSRLEKLGGHLWKLIEPVGRRFIPISSLPSAFMLGGIWGWLPCGLVYSVLIYSATAGGAIEGGLLMLGFGAGTLPAMVLLGAAGSRGQQYLQKIWVRRIAGGLIILFAFRMVYLLIQELAVFG